MKIGRVLDKIKLKLLGFGNYEKRNKILRKYFGHIGNNCCICTDKYGAEPQWVYIEDDVIVASGVRFINHDASCWNAYRNAGLKGILQAEKVGSIILKINCFIGAESIVLPNIVIGKNSIVGAGSVVTKSIPDNEVWGVPAHFLMSVNVYTEKMIKYYQNSPWLDIDIVDLKAEQKKTFDEYFESNK